MKLVLADPKYFKESVAIISDLVSEVKFKATVDGLEVVAMDPANVAMVVFKLLSSCFTQYEVSGSEEVTVNLNQVRQILRRAKNDDVLTLETEENKFKIILKSATKRAFSVPVLEADAKEQRVPELRFPFSVEMDAQQFADAIEDVSVVAESVTLLGEPEKLSVKAEGELSKAFIEIQPNENTSIRVDGEDKHKAKYSLEYLRKMIAGSKLADRVTLRFTNDYPLQLDYKVVDKLSLSFILAPRVDND